MRQIRGRIRDKRGVDYTEEQIRELAAAKLERFLDPTGVRSDLLEQFRTRPSLPAGFLYQFEDTTLFDSDKPIVRFFRRLLHPFLKLLFNPNVLSTTLHKQAAFNQYVHAAPAAAVRAAPQSGARADARQHRGEEPEDAARVGAEPAGVQRAPGAGARGGGAVQARRAGARRGTGRQPPRCNISEVEHARGQGPQGRSTGAPPPRAPQASPQARAPHGRHRRRSRSRGGSRRTGACRGRSRRAASTRSRAATACAHGAAGGVAAAGVQASRAAADAARAVDGGGAAAEADARR